MIVIHAYSSEEFNKPKSPAFLPAWLIDENNEVSKYSSANSWR